jgi:nitrogen regulatory protein PII-like uncharacterized protein
MKMNVRKFLNCNAHERAINALQHVADDSGFFYRDLKGSNDDSFARPEKSEGPSEENGDLIR